MRPFSSIAIPHSDILEGRLTMDVFAADLWQVFKGSAPDEYQSPEVFFRKTYLTVGMKNLLDVVKKRLDGRGGDPVIQLQTPFGGGKTHSLIALFHKANDWKANVVVIDGTALDPRETTLWGEIERQLTGNISLLKGGTTPGKEKLTELLKKHQPLLILMDEVLEYAIKSSGIKVGSSNLASQTVAFIQELSGTISILPNSILVLTLPSSLIEHYDESGEQLFQRLQKVLGRVEKVFTPVQDEEISQVIRRRLFSYIDENSATEVINDFLDYAERERILPEGVDIADYRERFKASYPFQPEVIDVLYKRWGSFPSFQRTRGVLRILALVVHSLKDSKIPFIRLGDFDLKNDDLRRELIKHIGLEYDSIIYSDITSSDSGAKKVDRALGSSYVPFSFGTKVATAIFMCSFSGGPEKGASVGEIKLYCAEPQIPSSVIVETITKLKENLFYLSDDGLYFTNQPNLNRILLNKIEGIEETNIEVEEKNLLMASIKKDIFDVYIWPNNSKDVPDTPKLKLIVLKDKDRYKEFLDYCGDRPRVYRNIVIFLCPIESERINFERTLKRKLAWEEIEKDKKLHLTDEQRKRVKEELKKLDVKENIRNLYRIILIPSKGDIKEFDLGISTYGADINIGKEVYDRLKSEGEILEKLSYLTLKDKYLRDNDYVQTKNILDAFYKTPGEVRIINENVLKEAIREGVRQGYFGLGTLEDGEPRWKYFKAEAKPELVENEIIIKSKLCEEPEPKKISDTKIEEYIEQIRRCDDIETLNEIKEEVAQYELKPEQKKKIWDEIEKKVNDLKRKQSEYHSVYLELNIPMGKFSDLKKMIDLIQTKFKQVFVKVEISAREGSISKSEYEDKILEAIRQAGIEIKGERLE
jgi:predicted AAA+ superfamily ATPase